jgi:hypothetical protein
MKRTSLVLFTLVAPTLGLAEVSTLECKGTAPSGTQQTITVSYDEQAGWVDDNGTIKMRDGVATNFLTGIKVFIDRQSGQYETRKTTAGEKFKGTCKKVAPKA